ncbi:MAG: hypothetical protein V3V08_12250 [Nannocystaceae bacterium]
MIVVDPWHWLESEGALPEAPPQLRTKALAVAQCIEYGGPLSVHSGRETLIRCRRRPHGRVCSGFLWVVKTQADEIHAFCPTCGKDEFLIHNWQDTLWAAGPMEPLPLEEVGAGGEGVDETGRANEPLFEQRLRKALDPLQSPVPLASLLLMIEAADKPAEVVQTVMRRAKTVDARLLRDFLRALMDAWHAKKQRMPAVSRVNERPGGEDLATPMPGRHARRVRTSHVAVSHGAQCLCGSGKPRLRCCFLN